jgi:hypothetical protein
MPLDLQRKRDLGRILDDTFALYRAHWRTLLAIALVVVVPVHLIVFGAGLGWLWEGYDAPETGDALEWSDLTDSLVGLAAQVLVVVPLVTAMTVHVIRAAGSGQSATTGDALRAGLQVFAALVGAVVLVALGVTAGLFFLIVPGLILMVRWAVVPQIVVIEGRLGGDALRRGFDLTRGQGWLTFLVVLVTNLLAGVCSGLIQVPLVYAAEAADSQAIVLVGQMLGLLITVPIVAVSLTLLYYTLVAVKEGVVTPPPSAPVLPGAQPVPGPQTLPGVPGTFGDGFAPPTPPDR